MKSVIQAIPIPSGALINRHLPGADFHDCYAVPIEPDSPSALAIFLVMAARTPGWVNRLMAIRNHLVTMLGLKNLGHLNAINESKSAGDYRVGDRVGIFTIEAMRDDEVILGDSDKHLDVKVSVCKVSDAARLLLAITTVVQTHNMLGRVYMAFVAPMHRRIVPATLARLEQGQNATR